MKYKRNAKTRTNIEQNNKEATELVLTLDENGTK